MTRGSLYQPGGAGDARVVHATAEAPSSARGAAGVGVPTPVQVQPPSPGPGRQPLGSVAAAVARSPRRTVAAIVGATILGAAVVTLLAGVLAGVFVALAGSLSLHLVGWLISIDRRAQLAGEAAITAAQRAGIEMAVAALDARDAATADHSEEVVNLAALLAERLDVDGDERRHLLAAAQLHDIGKVAIPNEILNKTGPLTDHEWAIIREHTPAGEKILCSVPELTAVARIVRHAHEHYDGSGYPDGLAGDEIPLASRIILCADAFHAIRSDRPYRPGRPARLALEEIRSRAGTQFDPAVAGALEQAAADLRAGATAPGLRGALEKRRLAALLTVLLLGVGSAVAANTFVRDWIESLRGPDVGETTPRPTGPGDPCPILDPAGVVCSWAQPRAALTLRREAGGRLAPERALAVARERGVSVFQLPPRGAPGGGTRQAAAGVVVWPGTPRARDVQRAGVGSPFFPAAPGSPVAAAPPGSPTGASSPGAGTGAPGTTAAPGVDTPRPEQDDDGGKKGKRGKARGREKGPARGREKTGPPNGRGPTGAGPPGQQKRDDDDGDRVERGDDRPDAPPPVAAPPARSDDDADDGTRGEGGGSGKTKKDKGDS